MTKEKVKKAKIEESVIKGYTVAHEVEVGVGLVRIAFVPKKKDLPYVYISKHSENLWLVVYTDREGKKLGGANLVGHKGQVVSNHALPSIVEDLVKQAKVTMEKEVVPGKILARPVIPVPEIGELQWELKVKDILTAPLKAFDALTKLPAYVIDYALNIDSSKDRHKASLNGVNSDLVVSFMDRFSLTKRDLSSLLGINERTLYSQLKEGKLDEKNSDRFLLIVSVFEEGVDALMSEKAFIEWLHTPHSHFDKETPFSLLTTINGAEAVREELIRTKYGVLS